MYRNDGNKVKVVFYLLLGIYLQLCQLIFWEKKKNVFTSHPSDCPKKTQSHWTCTIWFALYRNVHRMGIVDKCWSSRCSSTNQMCSFGVCCVVCVHGCNFSTYLSQTNVCIKRTSSRKRTNYIRVRLLRRNCVSDLPFDGTLSLLFTMIRPHK